LGTLVLSAWVAAAGPVGIFARQDFSGKEASAPGEEYGTTQADNGSGLNIPRSETRVADDRIAALFTFAIKAVLVAVVVLLLVAVARAVKDAMARRSRDGGQAPADELAPEAMLRAARESEELLEVGTPANAVVAAWVRLEEAASSAGVRDDRTRTSTELAAAVLRRFAVDGAALERLAGLYREARFSSHDIGEQMREQAREALGQVTRDLVRAVPADSRSGAPTGSPR
jgi:hypothetical protein